jgi:hypothetical protein
MRRPRGQQGSWFAEWNGEKLPCVHERWTKGTWPEYVDPGVDERPEWGPFIAALSSSKKALLTTSDAPDDGGAWRRTGYTAVYEIENVRTEGNKLRFKFVRRMHSF